MIVAIITARGGSKGLPGKNIKLLAGKPLIAHTINAAIDSDMFDKVIVTTDDYEIKQISLQYGAEVIDRPKELATDGATSSDVVAHVLEKLMETDCDASTFVLLQPTSPLRNKVHIKEALNQYHQLAGRSLISVCLASNHPYKSLLSIDDKNDALIPTIDWLSLSAPRQQLPEAYHINGAIYIGEAKLFLAQRTFFVKPLLTYLMDQNDSVDIDTEQDFLFTEYLLTRA